MTQVKVPAAYFTPRPTRQSLWSYHAFQDDCSRPQSTKKVPKLKLSEQEILKLRMEWQTELDISGPTSFKGRGCIFLRLAHDSQSYPKTLHSTLISIQFLLHYEFPYPIQVWHQNEFDASHIAALEAYPGVTVHNLAPGGPIKKVTNRVRYINLVNTGTTDLIKVPSQ